MGPAARAGASPASNNIAPEIAKEILVLARMQTSIDLSENRCQTRRLAKCHYHIRDVGSRTYAHFAADALHLSSEHLKR